MALPMISETREAYAGAEITVLTPEHLTDLFDNNPAIDHIIKIPSAHVHGLISVMKIKDLIAVGNYDVGYILPPSFGAAAGFKLAGIKERIGYIADGRRLLLTKPLPLPTPLNETHRSETYFNLLRRAANIDPEFIRPKIFVNDDEVSRALEMLSGFGVRQSDDYAVIAFRAVAESRRWGIHNYRELAKVLITRHGLKIVLIGSADDIRDGDEIVSGAGQSDVVNLAGKTTLREASALLSQAQVFVGNDSGPAHLAAAVGIPLVVLSGADDPGETSPISSRKHLIQATGLECLGCVKNNCPLKGDTRMLCMKNISIETIACEVARIIND